MNEQNAALKPSFEQMKGLNHTLPLRQGCNRKFDKSGLTCYFCNDTYERLQQDYYVLRNNTPNISNVHSYVCKPCHDRGTRNCNAGGYFNIDRDRCAVCSSSGPDVSVRAAKRPKTEALVDGKLLCLLCLKWIEKDGDVPPGQF